MNNTTNLKQQTKKGLYWSFFNQFATNGMQFCVGIVMARLLSPSDYGITALPAVFMAIANILQNGGLSDALVRKTDLREEDLSTSFYYSISMGILMYFSLFSTAPLIADFYDTPILIPLLRVTALGFLWGPLNTSQNVILSRRLDFKTPTKISLFSRIISAGVGIGMAYAGYGLWALVISGLLASLITVFLSWLAVRWIPRTGWSKASFKYLWGYGNKIMMSYGLNTLYENITPIFVAKYYSPADLGVYNRAQGYAALPSQQINGVIQRVTFPVLSKMQDDDEFLARNYRRMLRVSAFIVFPIMMMLSALARPFVILLITEKWESCIILLQIICFSMMWYPVHAINLNLLQVKGRSDYFLKLEIIKKIIGVSMLCITVPIGIVAMCYGSICTSIICLGVNTHYTWKLIGYGFKRQMREMLPTLLHALVMGAIAWTAVQLLPTIESQLIGGILSGATYYIIGAWLLKFKELQEVVSLIKRKK